jgi:hypothetical protein
VLSGSVLPGVQLPGSPFDDSPLVGSPGLLIPDLLVPELELPGPVLSGSGPSGLLLPGALSRAGLSSASTSPYISPAIALLRALGAPSGSGSSSNIAVAAPADSRIRVIILVMHLNQVLKFLMPSKNVMPLVLNGWNSCRPMIVENIRGRGDRRAKSVTQNSNEPTECFLSSNKLSQYPEALRIRGLDIKERDGERQLLWENKEEECPECTWRRANPHRTDAAPDCFIFTDESTIKVFPPAL